MAHQSPVIMVVDDDVDFLEINRHILEAAGYRVQCSADPDQALQIMAQDPPDLIITDLMMQTMDSGFNFSRQLKEDPRYKNVPVIITTSVSSQLGFNFHPRKPEELAAMHIDAYFDKPIAPQQLLDTIQTLLARRPQQE
jgi:CheY-like chemotaxis protein